MTSRALVLSALCTAACTPSASQPLSLEPADFMLAGVPHDADSVEIRLSFGEPDSIVAAPDPFDAFQAIASWHYNGFLIRFSGQPEPSSFLITGGDEATHRGIRVGDPADRVLRMYGQPAYRHDAIWTYTDPLAAEGVGVLEFLIEDDSVSRIHLGRANE